MKCTRTALLASAIFAAATVVPAAATQPIGQAASRGSQPTAAATIPGPLSGFLRLAAISTKASPDQVLPLLARNMVLHGYDGWESNRQPTEYLILLRRYVQQARELRALAGSDGVIRVPSCDQASRLLAVLGYRLRSACGSQTSLETADPSRAFVTLYSAFPLTDLEDAVRAGKAFTYTYPATDLPMLFSRDDWLSAGTSLKQPKGDVLDALLNDPSLARLYSAMARLDDETRDALRSSFGLRALLPYAPILDFYGGEISIRSGHVLVPGGSAAEPAWQRLVGTSPNDGAKFVMDLVTKDSGWAAALFDVLSRTDAARQRYFTEPSRLQRFYTALRGRDPSPGPARAVFRSDTAVFLLVSRLPLDDNGTPSVPGNVELWNRILKHNLGGSPAKTADDLVSVLFRLASRNTTSGLVELYLLVGEIDRDRGQHLKSETVKLLAEKYSRYRDQYSTFCEFRSLNDDSIRRFVTVADSLDGIRNVFLRTDAIGSFQATIGIWQILARQGEISKAEQNDSWQKTIAPFHRLHSSPQLFDAARASLRALVHAAGGTSELSQDEVVSLLAGPTQSTPEGRQTQRQLADDINRVMVSQRLVPLDTLFAFRDGLDQLADGKTTGEALLPMAQRLREFEMPRPLFTGGERAAWSYGVNIATTHDDAQTRTDWVRLVTTPKSRGDLEKARGRLAPMLRDSLVGLNYAYYAPPGAQMVHNNALFVRSHDFSGTTQTGGAQSWETPVIMGSGMPAARGARLVGSLADLPYVLAALEEDFMVPENAQALVWADTAPTLMAGAVVPRWWHVSQNELHAIALYQRAGEELLRGSAQDQQTRQHVMGILAECMLPARAQQFQDALRIASADGLPELAPIESLYLANAFLRRFPQATNSWGPAGHELESLLRDHPEEVRWDRLSQDFGVPHPAFAHSYEPALLMGQPLPAIMDYGSRLFAESWQSNNLYWARLADEQGYSPVALNRLVPRLTLRMLEKIFATDLEDWPALLHALHESGDEFRRNAMESSKTTAAVE